MRLTFELAWRNVWRQPRRSILTTMGIGFTCAILVFFRSVQLSSYDTSIRISTNIFQGHLQLQKEGYFDKPQVRKFFQATPSLLKRLRENTLVENISPRAAAFALASSDNRSYGAQVIGVQASSEKLISSIPGTIKLGSYLEDQDELSAVIGETLAKNLQLKLGGELTLLGQGADGSMAASVVTIKGIFSSGSPAIDRAMLHIPLHTFQDTFGMPGSIHSIVLRSKDLGKVAKLKKSLQNELQTELSKQDLSVLAWQQLLPGLKQSIDMDYYTSWLFFGTLALIVGFLVLNTFLMSVLERTREFGVMLALGTTPLGVSKLIFIESMLLALCGIVSGALLGSCLTWYFGVYGFAIPGSEEIMKMWNLPALLYPKVTLQVLLGGPGFILLISLLSIVYPARRIHRLEVVEALRAV